MVASPEKKPMTDPVLDHALAHKAQLIDALQVPCGQARLLAGDPAMAKGMEDARQFIEARLGAMGFSEHPTPDASRTAVGNPLS